MQDVTVEVDILVASIWPQALGAPSIRASGDSDDLGGASRRRYGSSRAYATPADRSARRHARACVDDGRFSEAVAAAVSRRAAV